MKYRIEIRGEVEVMFDGTGCRPATGPEVALWAVVKKLRKDKARLDWLSKHDACYRTYGPGGRWISRRNNDAMTTGEGRTPRQAIDDAMRKDAL